MNHITAAGNTEVPAYLLLRQGGFEVTLKALGEHEELWTATRQGLSFSGNGLLELVALWQIWKERGSAWKASDSEIDAFMQRFYPKNQS